MMLATKTFVPIYHQLKLQIEAQIHSGAWKPGEQVPSESELGEQFKISRTTFRQALGELVNQGLLTRVQGNGTFVAQPRIKQYLNRPTGFTEDTYTRHMKPSSQLLQQGIESASTHVASALQIAEESHIIVLERLRMADDLPTAVEISRLRQDLCLTFSTEELSGSSLYSYFTEKCKIILATTYQDMEAIACPQPLAHLLGISKGGPVLHIYCTTFVQMVRPFEQIESFYRAGELANIVPILSDHFMLHNIPALGSRLER